LSSTSSLNTYITPWQNPAKHRLYPNVDYRRSGFFDSISMNFRQPTVGPISRDQKRHASLDARVNANYANFEHTSSAKLKIFLRHDINHYSAASLNTWPWLVQRFPMDFARRKSSGTMYTSIEVSEDANVTVISVRDSEQHGRRCDRPPFCFLGSPFQLSI